MYLDYKNPDSIAMNTTLVMQDLRALRDHLRRRSGKPLDVRLVSNEDGELWFATGDVQYDTTHGAACDATTIEPTTSDDELSAAAGELVRSIVDQLAELEADRSPEWVAVVGEPCRWATCPLFGRIVVSPGDHAHHSEVQ